MRSRNNNGISNEVLGQAWIKILKFLQAPSRIFFSYLNASRLGFSGNPMCGASPHSTMVMVRAVLWLPCRIFRHSAQMRSPEMMAMPLALAVMASRVEDSWRVGSLLMRPWKRK